MKRLKNYLAKKIGKIIISYNYPPVVGGIETYAFELISFFKKNYSNEYDFIFNETQKPVTGIFRAMSFMIFIIKTIFKISKKKYKTIHLTNFLEFQQVASKILEIL